MLKKKRPNLENLAIFGKFASNSKKAPGFLVKNSNNAQNSPSISFFCLPFQIHVGKLQKLQKINFPLPIHPSCIEPWLLAAQNLFRHSYGTKNLTCAILRKYITSKRIDANTWFTFSDKMSGLTHETWNWTQKCVHWVIMILSYGLSNTEQKREKKTASNDARQKTVWLSISGRMEEVSGSSTWSPTRIQRGSTTRHYISKETKSTAARGRQTEWLAQACEYTSEPFSDERHKIRYGKTKLPFVGTNVPNRTKICNEPLATGPLDVGLHYGWEVFVVCFVCLLQVKNKITKIHRKFPKIL